MNKLTRQEVLSTILSSKVVAVIRMSNSDDALSVIEAISEGGIKCIEITMTVPNAVSVIDYLKHSIDKDVLIGAGTVLTEVQAREVIKAGVQFVVSPVFDPRMLQIGTEAGVVTIPGAFSPTEIYKAWNSGADIVKIFPASVLGTEFIRGLKGPMPDIRLMPTGGVTIDNAADWIRSGASVVAIGGDLLDKKAIQDRRWNVISERARRLVEGCQSVTNRGEKV